MPLTYPELATELQTDPAGLGYAQHITSGADGALADALNQVRAGIMVRRTDILASEILEQIDRVDFQANPANSLLTYFQTAMQQDNLRLTDDAGNDTRILANLKALFSIGTFTRTRLNQIARRQGSRAEQLFGSGVTVSHLDVAAALGRA